MGKYSASLLPSQKHKQVVELPHLFEHFQESGLLSKVNKERGIGAGTFPVTKVHPPQAHRVSAGLLPDICFVLPAKKR